LGEPQPPTLQALTVVIAAVRLEGLPMNPIFSSVARIRSALAAASLVGLCAAPAGAITVAPGGGPVALLGTTAAAWPDLAGGILEDVVTTWVSADDPTYGFPGAEGHLQSRVVRSSSTGRLDFYWRVTANVASYPAFLPLQLNLSQLVLANFLTGAGFDADYRLDGVGSEPPMDGVSADGSRFSFEFANNSFGPGESSYFLLLHSNAIDYDNSALARLGETTVSTFAPLAAVPEPSTYAFLLAGLVGIAAWRRRDLRAD
jgi:hypothetical protein